MKQADTIVYDRPFAMRIPDRLREKLEYDAALEHLKPAQIARRMLMQSYGLLPKRRDLKRKAS